MNDLPQIGATVRRIEPPSNGAATVAGIELATIPPSVLLSYAEGGEGWWPLDCIEAVPGSEEGAPA